MNPLALAGIGVGTLSGLFGGSRRPKPTSIKDLMAQFGPGALNRNTLMLYNMLAGSPQFRNALNQNALAGGRLSGNINAGLSRRGLSTSGIGTVASSLGQSASAFGESALRGGLFGQAGDMASNNLSQILASFTSMQNAGMQAQPNVFEQFGSSLLNAGANSIFTKK